MCTNFDSPQPELFRTDLNWPIPTFNYATAQYPGYLAPVRLRDHESDEAVLREAMFGLVPFWSKDDKASRKTYNARSESVASKASYREPWKKRRYALVPMAAFYEPDYETGKAVRWKIERQDKRAFTVAAIWDYWKRPTGEGLHSFSMVTINANDHPVMGRFHRPDDEKRSLVIVPPERRDEWLQATPNEAREFCRCPQKNLLRVPPQSNHRTSRLNQQTDVKGVASSKGNLCALSEARSRNRPTAVIDLCGA